MSRHTQVTLPDHAFDRAAPTLRPPSTAGDAAPVAKGATACAGPGLDPKPADAPHGPGASSHAPALLLRDDWHAHLEDWRRLTPRKRAALRTIAQALASTDDPNAEYLAELIGRLTR